MDLRIDAAQFQISLFRIRDQKCTVLRLFKPGSAGNRERLLQCSPVTCAGLLFGSL